MANEAVAEEHLASAVESHSVRIDAEGSSRHPHLAALVDTCGAPASRDLADAIHLLCAVHGSHPGLTDLALITCAAGEARDWLHDTADAFDRERLYLVRLTSSIGPMPSTPGAMQTENALLALRHAIETLAKSERPGCAFGAAATLMHDWRAFRPLLDHAADRSGVECPPCTLPDLDCIAAAMAAGSPDGASKRALGFGSHQLLLQHRGLLDLMEARALARGD